MSSTKAVRSRPAGHPIMYQTWDKLLFLHWAVPEERLRAMIPEELELETWDGTAWIGVSPFTMWGLRPPLLPAVPLLSQTHELNVRTYVRFDGVPGVWFFSLDASNPFAVIGARLGFRLPYFHARMKLEEAGSTLRFTSRRRHPGAVEARFEAEWTRGEPIAELSPGTRDFFLIERYALYTRSRKRLWRARIHHRPWPLSAAILNRLSTTMLEAQGIETPSAPPLLHQLREPLKVAVWAPERLGG